MNNGCSDEAIRMLVAARSRDEVRRKKLMTITAKAKVIL